MTVVPCVHYWLEVTVDRGKVIAICKYRGCQKRGEFTMRDWKELFALGQAYAKPHKT